MCQRQHFLVTTQVILAGSTSLLHTAFFPSCFIFSAFLSSSAYLITPKSGLQLFLFLNFVLPTYFSGFLSALSYTYSINKYKNKTEIGLHLGKSKSRAVLLLLLFSCYLMISNAGTYCWVFFSFFISQILSICILLPHFFWSTPLTLALNYLFICKCITFTTAPTFTSSINNTNTSSDFSETHFWGTNPASIPVPAPHQMKSVQWLQKVGCLKKRAMNLWSFTSCTFFCRRAPWRAKPRMGWRGPSSPSLLLAAAESAILRVSEQLPFTLIETELPSVSCRCPKQTLSGAAKVFPRAFFLSFREDVLLTELGPANRWFSVVFFSNCCVLRLRRRLLLLHCLPAASSFFSERSDSSSEREREEREERQLLIYLICSCTSYRSKALPVI